MARLTFFLFSLGLAAAQPASEGRAIGSGTVKGENPNPLGGTRVAAVVKDADSDAGAPEGPVTVGKIDNLKGTIHYLLCDKYTSGSLKERANNIGAYLAKNDNPNSQWFVFLWKDTEGWGSTKKKGNRHVLYDVCGHDIWVFQREDKYYDRTSCSSDEKDRAETIIRGAASPGGEYGPVRDNIKKELAANDVEILFTVVGGYNSNWNFGFTGHTSCGRWVNINTSDTGDDYQVYFFLQ